MKASYDDLASQPTPLLAHVIIDTLHHFVVVYRFEAEKVYIGDPGRGRVWMSKTEFLSIWQHRVALLLRPTPLLLRESRQHWFRWIARHFSSEMSWVQQSLFLGIVYTVLGLSTAVFVQGLIDQHIPGEDTEQIVFASGAILFLQLCRGGVGFLRQRFIIELNRRVSLRVGKEFLGHLFRLPSSFFDTRRTGDITARLNDSVRVQGAILQLIGTTVSDLMIISGSLLFLAVMAPPLAIVALVAVPLYGTILGYTTREIKRQQHSAMNDFASLESAYIDSLQGVETVRAFNAADLFVRRTEHLYSDFQESGARLGHTQARVGLWAELCSAAVIVTALGYGAWLVTQDQLLLGQMIAGYSLLAGTLPPIGGLVNASVALQGASVAAMRLRDLLLSETEPNPGRDKFSMTDSLLLDDVHFAWSRGAATLQGVNLRIPRGKITGLCGVSGAGKSTVVKLLERRYAPTSGNLQIDGRPASSVDLAEWRREVIVVPEHVKIFSGTLAENISLGRTDDTTDALSAWLDGCGFAAFVRRFPAGLSTRIGEEERALSAGERQIVGLLRGILHSPSVLVLDEGMSLVDSELFQIVYQFLDRYAETNAVLLISHHLQSLMHAGAVYVLEDGRIVDSGPPLELLGREGRFRDLWNMRDFTNSFEVNR